MLTVSDTAAKLVKKFNTLPSKRFGELVTEVNHEDMSAYIRKARIAKKITATSIAREMGMSRCEVHFLETGARKWNIEKLVKYISALNKVNKAKSERRA